MSEIIPAATILLLRDEPDFEVLMIERHADIGFAGGALVFPGGRMETSDGAQEWAGLCDGYDQTPPEERAPRVAAIREAFEEAGILYARKAGEAALISGAYAEELGVHRAAIENDDTLFRKLIEGEGLRLACDALYLFARWMPPARVVHHRRYDTWFFAAKAAPGQRALEDGNEATEAIWLTPQAALAARDEGTRKMIFPTSRNVELLTVRETVDETLQFAARRKIEKIEPTIVEEDGEAYLAIPDDQGYPITRERITTAMRG